MTGHKPWSQIQHKSRERRGPRCSSCGSTNVLSEHRDTFGATEPPREAYGHWHVCQECGHEASAHVYTVVLLSPTEPRVVETLQLELANAPQAEQPLRLGDERTVYPIASVEQFTTTGRQGIICHPEAGWRVVFDVEGFYYPLRAAVALALESWFRRQNLELPESEGAAGALAVADAIDDALGTSLPPPIPLEGEALDAVYYALNKGGLSDPDDPAQAEQAALWRAVREPHHRRISEQ